jgi:hypothetical protein
MELGFRGPNGSSDTQENPRFKWNPKLHNRVYKFTPLVVLLSQIIQIPT